MTRLTYVIVQGVSRSTIWHRSIVHSTDQNSRTLRPRVREADKCGERLAPSSILGISEARISEEATAPYLAATNVKDSHMEYSSKRVEGFDAK
jgi:hypothetical protein